MDLDPVLLSRFQFGFVMSFHFLFPAFTIGVASWLAVLEALWLKTGHAEYRTLYKFWIKIFAVSFGVGVVTGIVMTYQFGTNWSELSRIGGSILGPLLGYEVVMAFFLEAGFLGIMLFGWDKVPRAVHLAATVAVAVGTALSAFWILSANSWLHTPAGYELVNGVVEPIDWFAIVFNPSFPIRFLHTVTAAYLTTAFVIIGVSAWYLLRGRAVLESRRAFSMGLWLIAVLAPLQIFFGDQSGLEVREHQPAKLAAIEAHWQTGGDVPLILFAWPDQAGEKNDFTIEIPHIGSLILTHSWGGSVQGLKDFPPQDRPSVATVFWTFRVMVGLGFLMLGAGVLGLVLRATGRLYDSRWFQRIMVAMIPSGFVAVIAGWYTTEIGRQPWVVQGLLRTEDAHSPVGGGSVLLSVVLFVLIYAMLLGSAVYYIVKLIRIGPEAPEADREETFKTPARPFSLPDASLESGE
ncbi:MULTISPECIES: cytochrome ubiquinol oxidase subunit I [Inquilinus]|uniref:Cytochrome d ubiquinol oxidase subunit I n=1 Tax=Inquilinus ginsengisoli TaxID=363840 RepID=A0ABU1JV54_9PROT|nr:cytochrome ubiquinol oxidase subunit I [Inquilinus ginsengisoli]MDR6292498.1 cytochrome d ubiquinol oxidase subunit I [Inquilinus ginsengisoli]